MNILSLFDGISGGQVALKRAGIRCNKYYASEINKESIEVTQYNYPDTIQLGDVEKLGKDSIDTLPKIDLLMGGVAMSRPVFCKQSERRIKRCTI